jgi:hypothetical protein
MSIVAAGWGSKSWRNPVKKKLTFAAAGAALLALVPMQLGGHSSSQAMTCTPNEPLRTACAVVFGTVLGTVCTGHVQKLPPVGVTTAATIGWPVECPPLG